MSLKVCSKCGEKFMTEYNKRMCPDCAAPLSDKELSSLGCEDMVKHFEQDIGLRLQRVAWGHFDG